MKRALLVWNPAATTTTPGVRDVIARALSSDLHVELAETRERHHATEIAADAARHADVDLVLVLGGDGTINEAVNGLAGSGIPLGAIPGGGTNVFARTLGYPNDPVEATSMMLANIRNQSTRTIPLGRINGRAFAFCAGAGFDAHVVREVESNPVAKRILGEGFFVVAALRLWMTPGAHRRAKIKVSWDGGEIPDGRIVIVGNSDPYTFLGPRPFRVVPHATLERASLDATIMRSLNPVGVARILASAFTSGSHHPTVRDLDSITLTCDDPIPYQVDGDVAGESAVLRVWSEPNALRVIA